MLQIIKVNKNHTFYIPETRIKSYPEWNFCK